MSRWTLDLAPDQTGRLAIVTGANTGIGFETALGLAQKGARVLLACRSADKGQAAVERIRAQVPGCTVEVQLLDLSDLGSVRRFADTFRASHTRLDLLVNNAGVMVPPFSRTAEGFELQFGTNHLGHFVLTAELLPLLRATAGARVVVVSSGVHHFGRIDFDDLNFERRRYRPWQAYSQSKLANLLFALELDRRLGGAEAPRVVGAHPGYTATDLQRTMFLGKVANPLFGMRPADGALPTLRAALDPEAGRASYWGPRWLNEMMGPPVRARINPKARDAAVAARLWSESERLTGTSYGLPTS
jgi:NAD(P)-dependent dehydrogenase (short-subunit alcohol dehydrogenase family)